MYKVGMVVQYRGSMYWIVSVSGSILELAPTPHGAGSFYVTEPFVAEMQQIE